jgi:hypothetical protein
MSIRISLASALLFTALSLACQGAESGGSEKAEAAPAKQVEPVTPAETNTAAEPKPTETTTGAKDANAETDTGEEVEPAAPLPDSFEQVGVDVCDQYVTDYGKCIEKMPEADREAARRVVFENITVWKQTAAGGPAGQKSLQTACRIAREQAKRATASSGCEW